MGSDRDHIVRARLSGRASSMRSVALLALGLALPGAHAWAQPLGASGAAQAASAQGTRAEPHTGVSRILNLLDWGAGNHAVLGQVKGELDERYKKLLEGVRDTLQIDRVLKQKREEAKALEESILHFRGQRTGYEASIIAEEFLVGHGESMLRIDDRQAQRYYFFSDDGLYKILVAYNTSVSRDVPFSEFIRQVTGRYGAPKAENWVNNEDGERVLKSIYWEDDQTRLIVEDRSSFFGTFVMKFVSISKGLPIEARHEQVRQGGAARQGGFAESMMGDIMEGSGASDENVVDRLTGVQHEIDYNAGRPGEEQLRYQAQPTPAAGKKAAPQKAKPQKAQPTAQPKPSVDDIIY